jgi:hypothetical protein
MEKRYFFFLLLTVSLSSCFQKFYKTNTAYSADAATLQKLVDEKKSFIVHSPQGVFAVKNVSVGAEDFTGEKISLNPDTKKYLNPSLDKNNHLEKKESGMVLNEVHLYTSIDLPAGDNLNLGINHIYRVDLYGLDKEATRDSRTLSIVGLGLGAGLVVAIIVGAASFTGQL